MMLICKIHKRSLLSVDVAVCMYLLCMWRVMYSGVTTDPADPAMWGAGLCGPKIMALIFSL